MNIAHPVSAIVESIGFSFLSSEEVKRLSVKQITNPTLLDEFTRPTIGGLYDPALGPLEPSDM